MRRRAVISPPAWASRCPRHRRPIAPKQAIFLVDTSLSAGPQFPLWTKLLRATLENNRDSIREFAVVFFNVETFWWQEKFVANTPENVDALMNYADGLALEGATDLGRALKEAASPAWLKAGHGSGPPPDLFLLSDGAATWGEDRWPLLAARPHRQAPLPEKGEGREVCTRSGPSEGLTLHALFAYRTGLAGGDPRLLAYLAEQTGGAVFSLVGEAEIASASVAHRNRPWRLTGIEMAGGHDLLVAGRPQYVFPGQQLLVVGRLEASGQWAVGSERRIAVSPQSPAPLLVFTLQQGKATQTISVKMDQVLTSELAARTFGQVATSQLEDVCGAAAAAEPVATAYARHFRVTGRTCSLLMLESEQDYARFNIKPEEDSFVVKDRPAGAIVAKAVAETTAAMSDPKANFLAWYRRVRESSEVHFDLPASLDVALEGLPAETFAVTAPPLQCKLRLRKDLPENLRQPWQSGLPDYETLAAEAQRRLTAYGADDALRGSARWSRIGRATRPWPATWPSRPSSGSGRARPITSCGGPARRGPSSRSPSTPWPIAWSRWAGPTWRSSTMNWPAAGSGTAASATSTTSPSWTIFASCGAWPTAVKRPCWPTTPRPGWPRSPPCSFATRPTWPR